MPTLMQKTPTREKMRDIAIFKNMVEVSSANGLKTILHQDDMIQYNSWHLTEYHSVDKILYRGDSKNLPESYRSFLEKIGSPKNVIVTESLQDTY